MSSIDDPVKSQRLLRHNLAQKPASPEPVDLTHDLSDLDAKEREARRVALCAMLKTTQSRQAKALRQRRPDMAAGETVAIIRGDFADYRGVVLDADFIHGRVMLNVDGVPEPQWVNFQYVISVSD